MVVPNVGDLLLETWLCDKNLFLDESSAGFDWKKNMCTSEGCSDVHMFYKVVLMVA